MQKGLLIGLALFAVAGCANNKPGLNDYGQQLKASCVGGDYASCSELGHQVRIDRLKMAQAAQTTGG